MVKVEEGVPFDVRALQADLTMNMIGVAQVGQAGQLSCN
jgi:hypothetical protein